MIITKASIFDLEGITACAERFFEYAKYADDDMPLDRETFGRTASMYISDGIVLLLKDGIYGRICGGIAGIIYPWVFNQSIPVMHEWFWWVDPEYRGSSGIKLLRKFEKESKKAGAVKIAMIKPETNLSEGVAKIYSRSGYKPLEETWIKSL